MIETTTLRAAGGIEARRLGLDLDRAVDDALADSFPASDPPPWNPGGAVCAARPPPADARRDVVVVTGRRRTARQWVESAAGAVGVTVLIPAAILIVGMPIALAVRGLIEAAAWLAAMAPK